MVNSTESPEEGKTIDALGLGIKEVVLYLGGVMSILIDGVSTP